eukprot:UN13931
MIRQYSRPTLRLGKSGWFKSQSRHLFQQNAVFDTYLHVHNRKNAASLDNSSEYEYLRDETAHRLVERIIDDR